MIIRAITQGVERNLADAHVGNIAYRGDIRKAYPIALKAPRLPINHQSYAIRLNEREPRFSYLEKDAKTALQALRRNLLRLNIDDELALESLKTFERCIPAIYVLPWGIS